MFFLFCCLVFRNETFKVVNYDFDRSLVSNSFLGIEQLSMAQQKLFKKTQRIFYICSYGGSGTGVLTSFLSRFGVSIWLHSRQVPPALCKVKNWKVSLNEPLNPNLAKKITVIFIYRNPTLAQISRWSVKHLNNLDYMCDKAPRIEDYAREGIDHLKYEEFFDNYISGKDNKNYNIICINYHKLWENVEDTLQALKIPLSEKEKFPPKIEGQTSRTKAEPWVYDVFDKLNENLIKKIEKMPHLIINYKKGKL